MHNGGRETADSKKAAEAAFFNVTEGLLGDFFLNGTGAFFGLIPALFSTFFSGIPAFLSAFFGFVPGFLRAFAHFTGEGIAFYLLLRARI